MNAIFLDVMQLKSLNPFTVMLMNDYVFHPELIYHIAVLFNAALYMKGVVSTKRDLPSYGFQAEIIDSLLMQVGTQTLTFYVYKRLESETQDRPLEHCSKFNLPAGPVADNRTVWVANDILEPFSLALDYPRLLRTTTDNVDAFLQSGRPKRQCVQYHTPVHI